MFVYEGDAFLLVRGDLRRQRVTSGVEKSARSVPASEPTRVEESTDAPRTSTRNPAYERDTMKDNIKE